MTATTGASATGTPDGDPADLCEQGRDLAASGHYARAAQVYERVLDGGSEEYRAQAAMGLAVARHGAGKVAEARAAARAAMATNDPEYGPRAACHLALTFEEEGRDDGAEQAWRHALDCGNDRYTAAAHHGLARILEDRGETEAAQPHWQGALDGGPATAPAAAQDYAERLLARGLPAEAEEAVHRGLEKDEQPGLRLLLGAVHVERAIAEFGAVVDAAAPQRPARRSAAQGGGPQAAGERRAEDRGEAAVGPGTAAAATELLARLLAVRGDADAAAQVWEEGAGHADADVAEDVRARLRRGFLPGDGEGDEAAAWWDPFLEAAEAEGTTPMLAGELFAALGDLHARAALPVVEGEVRVAELRRALEGAVRMPGSYVWGRALYDDFRERLRQASGSDGPVLPDGWPDQPE